MPQNGYYVQVGKIKKLYIAMDGLSMDRHWSFSRMLSEVPLSFSKSYKQCIIFQKALSRVTELSGPLHMGFHILQSVYIIFGDLLGACQKVVEWKKIVITKLSDSYDLCRSLCLMVLDEIGRMSWDLFIESESATLMVLL